MDAPEEVLVSAPVVSIDPRRRVWYFYDDNIANYSFGRSHPLQPQRSRLTHALLANYQVLKHLQVEIPRRATAESMTKFHTDDYISFLQTLGVDAPIESLQQGALWNIEDDLDCPFMEGVFEFCQIYAGGSIAAAQLLATTTAADVAIHWGGGYSHSSKDQASGFSFVNDVVLCILELLVRFRRVLYIDMDFSHCDGVEEAFYTTDRVMTLSFHKYSNSNYPGTGDISDVGYGQGKFCAVNVPLNDGIDDESYYRVFQRVVQEAADRYEPDAIVLLVSPSILAGDRFGTFNLTLDGVSNCVKFVQNLRRPLLLLGGGASSSANSARCWTHVTAKVLDLTLPDEIPFNHYYEFFAPRYRLSVEPTLITNLNTRASLNAYISKVLDNLSKLPPPASKSLLSPRIIPKGYGGELGIRRSSSGFMVNVVAPARTGESYNGSKSSPFISSLNSSFGREPTPPKQALPAELSPSVSTAAYAKPKTPDASMETFEIDASLDSNSVPSSGVVSSNNNNSNNNSNNESAPIVRETVEERKDDSDADADNDTEDDEELSGAILPELPMEDTLYREGSEDEDEYDDQGAGQDADAPALLHQHKRKHLDTVEEDYEDVDIDPEHQVDAEHGEDLPDDDAEDEDYEEPSRKRRSHRTTTQWDREAAQTMEALLTGQRTLQHDDVEEGEIEGDDEADVEAEAEADLEADLEAEGRAEQEMLPFEKLEAEELAEDEEDDIEERRQATLAYDALQ